MKLRQPLLFSALFITGFALAQPTLDQSTNGLIPVVGGYGLTSFTSNNAAEFYGPGPAGADVSYGFWTLPDNGGYDRFLEDPSLSSNSSTYPTATVLSTNGGSDTLAYKVDANGIELVGLSTSLEGNVAFSNGAMELVFPCTFGTTWSDPYALSYSAGGFPITRAGVVTGVADGYGDIALPNMMIPEVLRVKVRKVQTDNTPLGLVYRSFTTHYYYDVSTRYPVMKTSLDSVIVGGGTPAATFTAEWQFGAGTGIGDIAADEVVFNPYPNPTNGQVDLGIGEQELRSVEVFTATGQLVTGEVKRMSGLLSSVVDLSALPAGMYQLRVTNNEGLSGTRRVMVR